MYGYGYRNTFKPVASTGFDSSASALFAEVPDILPEAKQPINDLIVGFKNAGVWDNSGFSCFICVPSLDVNKVLIDIKSLTTVATPSGTGAPFTSPFNIAREVTPTSNGVYFANDGIILTGLTPSDDLDVNSNCIIYAISEKESSAGTWSFGAYNGTTQALIFSRNLSGTLTAYQHSSTANKGLNNQASTDDAPADIIMNRTASDYSELVKNSVVVDTSTDIQNGTLPTVELILNTFSNNGTPLGGKRNQSPVSIFGNMGGGVTSENRDIIASAMDAFRTSMFRNENTWTKQIVLDGNSHGTYWYASMFRGMNYYSFGEGIRFKNYSVSSQTTQNIQSNYASEAGSDYDASFTENWYVPVEATNDLFFNGDITQAKTDYQTLCETAQATGYSVCVVPIMCRKHAGNPGGLSETDWNLAMDEFNTWLFANYATFADAIVPVDSDTFIYRSAYASDAEYNTAVTALVTNTSVFIDEVHLTESKYAYWGQQIINTII